MIVIDRLSSEMGVGYEYLFRKLQEYTSSRNLKFREDVRIQKIFSEEEITFLACTMLEYLQEKSIDDPSKLSASMKNTEESYDEYAEEA